MTDQLTNHPTDDVTAGEPALATALGSTAGDGFAAVAGRGPAGSVVGGDQ